MKYYLGLNEGIPALVSTKLQDIKDVSEDIKEFELETESTIELVYVICQYNEYLFFNDLYEALNYAISDYDKIYIVNKNLDDAGIFNITTMKELPLNYISSMELLYRINNKLNKEEAFKEAYNFWKLFHNDYISTLKLLCDKYPKYKKEFEEHLNQANILKQELYKSREEFIENVYKNI